VPRSVVKVAGVPAAVDLTAAVATATATASATAVPATAPSGASLSSARLEHMEWRQEEDDAIVQMVRLHGRKWTKLASSFPGRTDNAVRNRFTRLCKLAREKAEQEGRADVDPIFLANAPEGRAEEDFVTAECYVPDGHVPMQKLSWQSPSGVVVEVIVPDMARQGSRLLFLVPRWITVYQEPTASAAAAAPATAPYSAASTSAVSSADPSTSANLAVVPATDKPASVPTVCEAGSEVPATSTRQQAGSLDQGEFPVTFLGEHPPSAAEERRGVEAPAVETAVANSGAAQADAAGIAAEPMGMHCEIGMTTDLLAEAHAKVKEVWACSPAPHP